jgi:hypothetical protein
MSRSNVKTKRIICIGNGVTGPVFAMALKKLSNHEIILVESRSAEAKAVGGAISLAPNGLKALEFIGAHDIVMKHGGRQENFKIIQGVTGSVLAEAQTADLFTPRYGYAVGDFIADHHVLSLIKPYSELWHYQTNVLQRATRTRKGTRCRDAV